MEDSRTSTSQTSTRSCSGATDVSRVYFISGHSTWPVLAHPFCGIEVSHKGQRNALHRQSIMLVFFRVPPSLRQAAGPLTENLPNVAAGSPGAFRADLLLEEPSPRGIQCRLSPRVLPPALMVRGAIAARCGAKRGHLLKLRKVEIVGFKSFCERTVVTFSGSGTTCIVGPNGCGKSNVVDAISWVLGEQSHKSLRAERMADCIFNGTTKRPPLGLAEVTITM